VIITVPTGQDLQINLTNNLSFTPSGATTANTVPTSLMIVGQLGGGLGTTATLTPAPDHSNAQANTTWPIANAGQSGNPPPQGKRVQSFSTEVAFGATASLTWTKPRAGTYLLESGTHPSIQVPMGLYGMLVVTQAPTTDPTGKIETGPGSAYVGVSAAAYDAEVALLFSELDPVQNSSVNSAVNTAGFSETMVWSGQPGGCGNGSSPTCYPPAVNYRPLYYFINGVAFDKSNASTSLFAAAPGTLAPASGPGSVLVRMVNAGLRMHVPSIVGSQTGATAVGGFSLIAEDGNPLPGVPRVQSEVFLPAGKTYDVMVNGPATGTTALPVYDRELSLSGNAIGRDAGMLAYISVNNSQLPAAPALQSAVANPDTYHSVVPGNTLSISDPSKGVIANDVNVYGVKAATQPAHGTLVLSANGTFSYAPDPTWSATTSPTITDSFTYQANANGPTATVTLNLAAVEGAGGIMIPSLAFTAKTATYINVPPPGVLSGAKDVAGYPLKVVTSSVAATGVSVAMQPNGGFIATVPQGMPGPYTFTFQAQNSQGTLSAAVMATITFPTANGPKVTVQDPASGTTISDYRWVIEEDRTFYVDPKCTTNPPPAGCPTSASGIVPTFGVNFHTSSMPFVAQGCTGPLSCESGQTLLGQPAVCDVGNGMCRTTAPQQTAVDPGQVVLDPKKRYYISVLPGDAANPFEGKPVGHGMGGAPIAPGQSSVTVLSEASPYPPGKLSVLVFEDDNPLNGEQDAGGGVDVISPNEPGLSGFNILLFDDMGGPGDPTGQMTYDMFNMPLSNNLAGTIDPSTGLDACPITQQATNDPTQKGITGMIVTCPTYEADGKTLSPLAGQAVVANLMPGRFSVVATPGADRIARGEEWLQTNTLDGQKGHDAFIRIGEPSYFQEYGPAGFHVSIGFANPAIINGRLPSVCAATTAAGGTCTNSVTGKVTTTRMSRVPDERLYSSGSRDSFFFSQCYVSLGDPDGADISFTKCNDDGTFSFTGIPDGSWRVTLFDQWNDQIVDGLSVPIAVSGGQTAPMGDVPVQQWQANLYTRTFVDDNMDGVSQSDESGIPLVDVTVRYRDGSLANLLSTDFKGIADFNETFPLFNWYVVEADTTRYKTTGIHTVYDAGGPSDFGPLTSTTPCSPTSDPPCGQSTIGRFLANTYEKNPLPPDLSVPGAVYCANADCTSASIASGPVASALTTHSTGRIDAPWVQTEGWQGFSGQNNFIEFGKRPYVPGENGGIRGHVIYASTRPFDDPQMLVQTQWEPLVAHVTINLYQEGTAPDGSQSLKLVDTTQTSSFDDWAQGFRHDGKPNMNCPGQSTSDLFYFTLYNQVSYLDWYNVTDNGSNLSGTPTALPYNSQYKCYDGLHNWNQIQPAPYDGMYSFPSVTGLDPSTGKPTGTNCAICTTDPDSTDPYRFGTPMLPPGKYVVEVVVPPGYELVKEEDKNILIGDAFIAPAPQQFGALASIFILPDQAAVAATYNANNTQNPTSNLGTTPSTQFVPGFSVEPVWPCVGLPRVVPDYISLFPQSKEVAPFAGATRNLCDRKEVILTDQRSVTAKFYIFTSTHIAAHFTGVITDDFTSEFDPFSPSFGEKFAPPNLPVSVKDWTGNEIARVYTDQWGTFDGLNYSTWEVNPPNPTGYSPTMMVYCMNDPGPIPNPSGTGTIPDPLFNPGYSQFCYELPFMPGQTQYLDTPVVPTSAFSEGYNHPDCAYPTATPAISSVTSSDAPGPWVKGPGSTLTINALGDQVVNNYGYSGPSSAIAPYNQKTVTRHYGFGNTAGTVTIGGISAMVTSWSDTQIQATVPSGVPACLIQQQGGPGGESCGQLVITAANGQQSIDSVMITIGGNTPKPWLAGQTIQSAIDAAQPGDLILIPPGAYNEMLLMWKPVRLQGSGAASTVINANTHPAGNLLDPWRRQVTCLFGLALNGTPITSTNQYDPSSQFSCSPAMQSQVDRLPLEATVGWDATLNGNLAEQLQEPTLMGAYEGAGITVLAKGVKFPAGTNPFGSDIFPAGTTLLSAADCATGTGSSNPYPSNFWCNPSRIDGLSVTDSSQGGGGIFVHGWAHNLEISNNRVYNNVGTLTGGISVGQGEFPPSYLQGSATNAPPGSCVSTNNPNQQLPYCFNENVEVHNNYVSLNSSIGDELFSATPAGAGGVTICTGADYYKLNYNWICGNMSGGDGGGVAHLGFIWNGDIEHNWIIFNQSINPTIPANGGGMVVMGAPDTDPVCAGGAPDADCPPGLSDGTGPGLSINANLFQGNAAESGSGGGIRLQGINGTEIANFPTTPALWNSVTLTNNIIINNVAGWDGGGISVQDAMNINMVNNTIASNDTTASSGVLFNTLGAPQASTPPPCGNTSGPNCDPITTSTPQPAGIVSMQHTANLLAGIPATVTCPTGNYSTTATNGECRSFSYPLLANNILWQNRAFNITVGGYSNAYQQNLVSLLPTLNQPPTDATAPQGNGVVITGGTGACMPGASYWDIGVRGDTGPSNHSSTHTLGPLFSIITDVSDYSSTNSNNIGGNPTFLSQYCNGSRVPPENGGLGYQVPPGISDATVPNPIFNLTPSATVDEGNNWINMSWGPLSMNHPVTSQPLGNYAPAAGSPAICGVPSGSAGASYAPPADFFGNPRGGSIDIGAVQSQSGRPVISSISPSSGARGYSVPITITGTGLSGITAVFASVPTVTVSHVTVVNDTTVTATLAIAASTKLGPINVTVSCASSSLAFTIVNPPVPAITSIAPAIGVRSSTVPVTITGTSLLTASAVTVSGTGITVSNVTPVSDTTVTATFTISSTAPRSVRNVNVTTLGGPSNFGTFTVPIPALTSISPSSGMRGTSVPVTLTGSGLTGATAITVSGGNVAAGSLVVVNDTTVTATLTIGGVAALSARNVTVTTPDGTTGNVTFTVTGPAPPTLTSITPNTGVRGTSVPVTLSGTHLTGATVINVSGAGITVSGLTVVNDSTVTATFGIAGTAALTARNVSVTTPAGTSGNVSFTVTAPAVPTLTSISPNTGMKGTSVPVTLTGTHLTGTSVINGFGAGVTVTNLTVVSDTSVTATFVVHPTATPGAKSVSVTTPGGTSNIVTFTVLAPSLTSISPTTGLLSSSVPITLTGAGLTGATGINVSGSGVTVSSFTVVNDTTITATFTIAGNAARSARTVSVSTPNNAPSGTTNTVTFTVAGPTLTSISPTSGTHGTSVSVTLTGQHLTGASGITVSGTGVTPSGITVVNDTTVTATFTIAATAATTARNVSVVTPHGATGNVTFTVN
jgi:hypothetical protein